MDGGFRTVFIVLDVFVQRTFLVDRKDVSEACMVVEWVAIDIVRRLFGRKNEDGSGLCLKASCSYCGILSIGYDGNKLDSSRSCPIRCEAR